MTNLEKQQLGKTLWAIADQLRGAMNADDFRDYMLSFLFLRYPISQTPSHQCFVGAIGTTVPTKPLGTRSPSRVQRPAAHLVQSSQIC